MALLARSAAVPSGQRKPRRAVIENRALPLRRGMTGGAFLAETGIDVVEIRGFVEVIQVACDARGGCAAIGTGMARLARYRSMRSAQLKPGSAVIKPGPLPLGRRVAAVTVERESGSAVVRALGIVVVGRVAGSAGSGGARIGPSAVAVHTSDGSMLPREREGACGVIELSAFPGGCLVAAGAVLGEIARRVVGIFDTCIIRSVAPEAVLRQAAESSPGMASVALECRMASRQLKTRPDIVIEHNIVPGVHIVAALTG